MEPNHLEELKRKLYMNRDTEHLTDTKKSNLHDIIFKAPKNWDAIKPAIQNGTNMMKKNSFFKKFFITSIVFFLVAIGFFALMTLRGTNTVSNKNIDIELLGNAFTSGGENLILESVVTNRNNSGIELASLILEYPKGSNSNQTEDKVRIKEDLGNISAGETKHHAFNVVLYGEQGAVKQMKLILEYKISGSNALFQKTFDYTVTLSVSPISLTVDAPDSTSANQRYSLSIKSILNSTNISPNMILRVDYPPGFAFESSNVSPTLGDNVFDLSDMKTGVAKDIRISGTLKGEQGEEKVFRVYVGEQKQNDQSVVGVIYNSTIHSVELAKPFLDAHFEMMNENKDTYVISGGGTVNGIIVWSNNSSSNISDAEITVTVTGQAFDKNSLKAEDGYYDTKTNTITWSRDTYSGFDSIPVGGSGTFPITFVTNTHSVSGSTLSPEISISVNSRGLQTGSGSVSEELTSIDRKTIRLGSDFSIISNVSHSNLDTGPIPPAVGRETTYTVSWSISNTTDPVANALVKTTLPTGVKFLQIVNQGDEDISYNDLSKEIVWKVGAVKKLSNGLIRKASFKIAITPASNQEKNDLTIINSTNISAVDSYSGNLISSNQKPVLSSMIAGSGDGLVVSK